MLVPSSHDKHTLVQHDRVVEALPAGAAHQSLRIGVLPGGMCGDDHLLEAQAVDPLPEAVAVDGVAVA
jgi:hypothetical protein